MCKMKDSGIAWIGEIPEEWEVRKFKDIFAFGRGLPITKENLVEIGIPVLSYGQIHAKNNPGTVVNTELFRFVPQMYLDTYKESLLNVGDILFADTSEDYEGIGNFIYIDSEQKIFAGYHTIICSPNFNMETKYLPYLFLTDIWRSQLRANVSGIKVFSITKKLLRDTSIIFPPLPEQRRIADYLDAKCAEIDHSMELVRQGIDKLKEYKKSVITEAVTKGLDPDVPMKDSGVPWIGEIPAEWIVSSVRWEFDNLDGRRKPISSENRVNTHGLYDYYGASGVIDKIDEYIFDEPLLLIGEDGANLALRNLPLIYVVTGKYWVNNHAHILKPKSTNNLFYMAHQLECVDLFHYLTGSTQPKLTQANLSKIPVVCPPLREQHRIAAYLDAKCAEIDTLIAQKQALLEKLAEYKKSLIFECVTGKREVAA